MTVIAKKKNSNKWIYILIGVLAVALIAAVVKAKQRPKGEEITAEKVEKRTIKEVVSASGKVFPEIEIKISPDVSGEIVELYVEEGDSVKIGQLLAKIDPEAIQSQVERGEASVNNAEAQLSGSMADIERNKAMVLQAKAQKEQIEAQLSYAKSIHERNEKLKKDGIISETDFENSLSNLRGLEANYRSADASLESSKANLNAAEQSTKAAQYIVKSNEASLKELKTNLKRTALYAPMGGIVSKLSVEKGERVVGSNMMAGTEMLRVANMGIMEVQVDVGENDIPRVSLNDEVEIEVDAYLDRKFKGRVRELANSATSTGSANSLNSDQITNFVVKIRLDPSSYSDLVSASNPYPFRPGMSASVDINTHTVENVLCIPIQSVTTREEKKKDKEVEKTKKEENDKLKEVVFTIPDGADTVRMVEVKTGIQDDTYIEVTSGLNVGDEVVVGPYSSISRKLESGMKFHRKKDKEKDVKVAEAK